MATEILVNDGGAPARILPFYASAAITGGQALDIVNGSGTPDGQVVAASAHGAAAQCVGFALTDASAGGTASVITGKGVILNVFCSGTIDEGDLLQVTADGSLVPGTTADSGVAVALEAAAHGSTNTLTRVITI